MARVLRKNFFGRRAARKNVESRASVNVVSGMLQLVRNDLREKQQTAEKFPTLYNLRQLKSSEEDELETRQRIASRVKERSASLIEVIPRLSSNPKAFFRLKRAQLKKARAAKQK